MEVVSSQPLATPGRRENPGIRPSCLRRRKLEVDVEIKRFG